MFVVSLCCVAVGALIGVRFKVLAVVPATFMAVAVTILVGVNGAWNIGGIALASIINVICLEVAYFGARVLRGLVRKERGSWVLRYHL